MSRAAISAGDYAGMPKTTPTGRAEAVYKAKNAGPRRAFPIGPAGIEIPARAARYRPDADDKLIKTIAAATVAQIEAEQTPAADYAAAVASFVVQFDRMWPADDMAVLERHGQATIVSSIYIHLDIPLEYSSPVVLTLRTARLVPARRDAAHFKHPRAAGPQPGVPAEVVPLLDQIIDVRRQSDVLKRSAFWASQYKATTKRWPVWAEIEEAFPQIGAWLARQRQEIINGAE